MAIKYYKALKETTIWEKGTIVSNEDSDSSYTPVDAIFVKDIEDVDESWWEGKGAIENNPGWFERVYPISTLKKKVFGTRIQAKAAAEALYEVK